VKRSVVRDDSGERSGYWVTVGLSTVFFEAEFVRAIAADATRRANRRSVRIIRRWFPDSCKDLEDGCANEIMGTRRKK